MAAEIGKDVTAVVVGVCIARRVAKGLRIVFNRSVFVAKFVKGIAAIVESVGQVLLREMSRLNDLAYYTGSSEFSWYAFV